jgi:hypothetical protein
MVFLKFCKIVIKNDNEWNEYIIFFFQEYIEKLKVIKIKDYVLKSYS